MKNRINWIMSSLVLIFILPFTYFITSNFLEKSYNLLIRDWIFTLIIIIISFCILIIEAAVVIRLNNIIKYQLAIPKIWKGIIQMIFNLFMVGVNLIAFLIFMLSIDLNYREKDIEIHKGEKYVVRASIAWLDKPVYYYHPYKNLLVYDADFKYSEEMRWEYYLENEIDHKEDPNPIPNITEEDIDNVMEEEEIEIEIIPSNIEYIQKIDDNLNYGFYLIDRAMSQYLYAFVQSKDEGLSWEIIYTFPANSEIYYGQFLDKELGFINFGSSEGLSLFMTNDGGLTWEDILINLPEENRNMIYVQDISKSGETIELILGLPSWSNSNQSIKYISVDKGQSWELKL